MPEMFDTVNAPIPRWILAFGAISAVLLAIGAALSLLAPQKLVAPGADINAACQIYAGYTFSRNVSLFLMLSFGLVKRSRSILTFTMALFSLINFCDGIMDMREGRIPIIAVAFLLSCVAAMASLKLFKSSALAIHSTSKVF
jgi:hypothetical protein